MSVTEEFEELSPLYSKWADSFLGGKIPREANAPCNSCVMLCDTPELKTEEEKSKFYNVKTKCCTYMPTIPNFLVGRILSDKETHSFGRSTIEKRIQDKISVSPLGLYQTPLYKIFYEKFSPTEFGKLETLRCPHYIEEGGLCGVWKNRNATCQTWFCKHIRGNVGRKFWNDGIKALFKSVEEGLSKWCVLQLNPNSAALEILFRVPDPEKFKSQAGEDGGENYNEAWGKWLGKEKDFYTEAGKLVSGLKWSEVVEICGTETKIREVITQGLYKKLRSPTLPERVGVGRFTVYNSSEEGVQISDGREVFDISHEVFNLLQNFNGSPLVAVREKIKKEVGAEVEDDLLRFLLDHQILVSK